MTQLDELALLRFDAETGRVMAVEAVERATELLSEMNAELTDVRESLASEEEFHEKARREGLVYLRTLEAVAISLDDARNADDDGDALRHVVNRILEAITYRARGFSIVEPETLQEVLRNREI